jgi:hypothetical protein
MTSVFADSKPLHLNAVVALGGLVCAFVSGFAQIAIFGINGPISVAPMNFVWVPRGEDRIFSLKRFQIQFPEPSGIGASSRFQVRADQDWRSPELEDDATKRNLVHSEGPRVYKCG